MALLVELPPSEDVPGAMDHWHRRVQEIGQQLPTVTDPEEIKKLQKEKDDLESYFRRLDEADKEAARLAARVREIDLQLIKLHSPAPR